MASADLLSLPTELLDRVYSYLDGNIYAESLYPSRPDIINISLTCRRLRESILPLVFEHVNLMLRWYAGVLQEPAIFRLRRDRPDLARHIRSVYIKTEFCQNHDLNLVFTPFNVPEELADWVNPAAGTEVSSEISLAHLHRQRVKSIAKGALNESLMSEFRTEASPLIMERISMFEDKVLGQEGSESALPPSERHRALYFLQNLAYETSEELAHPATLHHGPVRTDSDTGSRDRRTRRDAMMLQLDALIVTIICLPSNMRSLTFRAHMRGTKNNPRNMFALHVTAAAVRVFGDRLQRLTIISSPLESQQLGTLVPTRSVMESPVFTSEVLNELQALNTLAISDDEEEPHKRLRNLMSETQVKWAQLAATVVHLELWNCAHDKDTLFEFIRQFEGLRTLVLNDIMLVEQRVPGTTGIGQTIWLKWLIELRRERPHLTVRLVRPGYGRLARVGQVHLTSSATQWLLSEAIPTGCMVGYEREDRLTEDFESFLGLWSVDDGERGAQAREARKDGSLVDEAMTNRWKTFAHLRR